MLTSLIGGKSGNHLSMSAYLDELTTELTTVDAAIEAMPLYAIPGDPSTGFCEELLDLISYESQILALVIAQTRAELSPHR